MAKKIGERLLVAGRTNVGRVRSLNEDCFSIDLTASLLVLADGMGGHDAGEVASAKAVDSICRALNCFMESPSDDVQTVQNLAVDPQSEHTMMTIPTPVNQEDPTLDDLPNPVINVIVNAISAANAELNNINREKGYPAESGMGTTIVGMWAPDFSEEPVVFHIGDSRLYLFQGKRLKQITRDHSLYQQWVNLGSPGSPPPRNVLLQALGPSHKVTPDVCFLQVEPGDVVLLCSDGLTGMVEEVQIQKILKTVSSANLDEKCDLLIDMARDAGGKDNVTVIIGCFV